MTSYRLTFTQTETFTLDVEGEEGLTLEEAQEWGKHYLGEEGMEGLYEVGDSEVGVTKVDVLED